MLIIIHYVNTSILSLACTVSETRQWHKRLQLQKLEHVWSLQLRWLATRGWAILCPGQERCNASKTGKCQWFGCPANCKRSSFLIGERGFTWHLHAFTFCTDSPSSCFWRFEISSNSPLIHISSNHPCSSPSSIGQAASWNILAKSPLWLETDLNVSVHGTARPEAHCNVFIISYHFIPGVHSSKEAV